MRGAVATVLQDRETNRARSTCVLALALAATSVGCSASTGDGGTGPVGGLDRQRPRPGSVSPPSTAPRVAPDGEANGGEDAPNWRLFTPGDFTGGKLVVSLPKLRRGERLAVLPIQASGTQPGEVEVAISGVRPADVAPAALPREPTSDPRDLPDPIGLDAGLPLLDLGGGAPAPRIGERWSFCILDWSARPPAFVRRAARVRHATPSTVLWVAEDAAPSFDERLASLAGPDPWAALGETMEQRILPALATWFGTDALLAKGRVDLVFASLGGPGAYFGSQDLARPADGSPDCSEGGSNGGVAVYLASLDEVSSLTPAEAMKLWYPATIAHEMVHLTHARSRCLGDVCERPEPWIAEGLAEVARDAAGLGLSLPGWRAEAEAYLREGHRTRGVGDLARGYAPAHLFLRYLADRFGPELTRRIAGGAGLGLEELEEAAGLPFETALAHYATALLFSNEEASPSSHFDFRHAAYTPLHRAVGHLGALALPPGGHLALQVPAGGFAAILSGEGSGQAVTVTVRAAPGTRLHVVVARFTGAIPAWAPPGRAVPPGRLSR